MLQIFYRQQLFWLCSLLLLCFGCTAPYDRRAENRKDLTDTLKETRSIHDHVLSKKEADGNTTHAIPAETKTELAEPKTVDRGIWETISFELTMSDKTGRVPPEVLDNFGDELSLIKSALRNARPFIFHIKTEIEKKELPLEIALVPIIESAYNPRATSPAGAAGIWQLMPATARRFGVYQSRWYDGRRDILASTQAALVYFEELRDRFSGDWELIFAAYNCGERTVERAIDRNTRLGRDTHFDALDLPRATKKYVPNLIALIEILSHPETYGLQLAIIPEKRYFESVDVEGALDLNKAIEWTGIPESLFDRLNASFRRRLSLAGAPTLIHVPVDKAETLKKQLAALPAKARLQAEEHKVVRGETLSHIAQRSGISVSAIKRANRLRSSRLSIGQTLVIPTPPQALKLTDTRHSRPSARHTVVSGDNLWDLALLYNTTVSGIARANELNPKGLLKIGQTLLVPSSRHGDDRVAYVSSYRVKRGDSLWTIARRFNLSVKQLQKWNGIKATKPILPGQKLRIRPTNTSN